MTPLRDVRLDLERDVADRARARGCSRDEALASLLPRLGGASSSHAPDARHRCRCGSTATRHISVQLRRGDECETSALVCLACDHAWVPGRG